jgi:hypothetical protein
MIRSFFSLVNWCPDTSRNHRSPIGKDYQFCKTAVYDVSLKQSSDYRYYGISFEIFGGIKKSWMDRK